MNLEWIIPIIVVGVYVLSSLVRKPEDERPEKPRAPDRPRPAGNRPQQRQQAGDIDRFLEEVNRRRRKASESGSSAPAKKVPTGVPTVVPAPSASRPRQRPQTQASGGRSATPRARAPGAEFAVPVQAVAAVEVVEVAPGKQWPPPGHTFAAAGTLAPPPASAPSPAMNVAPGLVPLAALLQSGQAFRTAMLLKVIFDPPVCRRRGFPHA